MRLLGLLLSVIGVIVLLAVSPTKASAAVEWKGAFSWAPTSMVPGERAGILILPANKGSTPTGEYPTVKVDLPAGLSLAEYQEEAWSCVESSTVTCSFLFPFPVNAYAYGPIPVALVLDVAPNAPEGSFDVPVTFEGGGASAPVTQVERVIVGETPSGFGILPGGFTALALDPDGNDFTQAGGHPDSVSTTFSMTTKFNDPQDDPSNGSRFLQMVETLDHLDDVFVEAPAGLIGDPTAVPTCPDTGLVAQQECPPSSQVGVAVFDQRTVMGKRMSAVYNMEPDGNRPAQFAFDIPVDQPVTLVPTVRSDGDWGLTVDARNINEGNPVFLSGVTLWGVPADPSHDIQRCSLPNEVTRTCAGVDSLGNRNSRFPADQHNPDQEANPSTAPRKPFLSLPTRCNGQSDVTTIHISSWSDPAAFKPNGDPDPSDPNWKTYSAASPPITGCEDLDFSPSLQARPTTNAADSPTGLDVKLHVPQNEDPDGLATAHLKKTVVTLPPGLVVNPSGANGLGACSPAQIGMTSAVGNPDASFTRERATCPDSAKVGTVRVDTPLLGHPLPGSVYVATPHQNPFGSLLALYIEIDDPQSGIVGKLAGEVRPNPITGQLTSTFDDNPQVPFEDFTLNFFGGAAAPLRTPATCGTYSTTSELTPWSAPQSGPPATPKDTWAIERAPRGACATKAAALPNTPSFEAGSTSPLAGNYSPFVLNLRRDDGTQQFSALTVTPPPGLVAKLAGTPACSEGALAAAASKPGKTEQASPSCPAASAVGSVHAAAGAGPAPYHAPGTAYLAGPYKGAPLSLAIITPAVAGPFDLGTIVVRTALHLNSKTAQITAVSDPIPQILQGIPLDVRSVSVRMDKPRFTLNPTTCDPTAVSGTLLSTTGATAPLNNRFQLAECNRLAFKPKMALFLKGGTKRSKFPALRAVLTPRAGDANIASVSVAMPPSEFLAQQHIRTVCTRVQFAADQCPAAAIYGHATVYTPLLEYPLTGPVYLRASDNPLPDLVPDLRGPAHQPIKLEAAGRTDTVNRGLRNTFDFVPDAPFSKFVLKMRGGKKGLLENSRDICAQPYRATVKFGAHNGERHTARPKLRAGCGKKARKGGKGKRAGR
jgi:hypothetical protein